MNSKEKKIDAKKIRGEVKKLIPKQYPEKPKLLSCCGSFKETPCSTNWTA